MRKSKLMPIDNLSFLQRLQEYGILGYTWLLFVSFWAGTVRYLTTLDGKKPTCIGMLTEAAVSGFVGIITAMTCQYYHLDFLLTSAITGIFAHNGTRSLYLIGKILKKNIEEVINEPQPKQTRQAKREKNNDDNS